MKTISIMLFTFFVLAFCAVYQSCVQSDHITCKMYEDVKLNAFDISNATYTALYDSNEVFAKKFAFEIQYVTADTICHNTRSSFFNEAYATKYENIFIRDSIKEIEIYCTSLFQSQYPAGSVLNNLFNIPPIKNNSYGLEYPAANNLISLNEVPLQTDYYKFYVKIKTNNKSFVDTLPLIKIKI